MVYGIQASGTHSSGKFASSIGQQSLSVKQSVASLSLDDQTQAYVESVLASIEQMDQSSSDPQKQAMAAQHMVQQHQSFHRHLKQTDPDALSEMASPSSMRSSSTAKLDSGRVKGMSDGDKIALIQDMLSDGIDDLGELRNIIMMLGLFNQAPPAGLLKALGDALVMFMQEAKSQIQDPDELEGFLEQMGDLLQDLSSVLTDLAENPNGVKGLAADAVAPVSQVAATSLSLTPKMAPIGDTINASKEGQMTEQDGDIKQRFWAEMQAAVHYAAQAYAQKILDDLTVYAGEKTEDALNDILDRT